MHQGQDFPCGGGGQMISAAAPGLICFAAFTNGGYGNRVVLYHPNGDFMTTYNHMWSIVPTVKGASTGIPINTGDPIGPCGAGGNSRGAHLHFELGVTDACPSNPMKFAGYCYTNPLPYMNLGSVPGGGSGPPGMPTPGGASGTDAGSIMGEPGSSIGNAFEMVTTGCWLCNIFSVSYDLSMVIGERAFAKFGTAIANLIAVLLALWVLFEAAKLIAPFGPMSGPAGVANMVVVRIGIALMVIVALRSFEFYNSYIQSPMMGAGVQLSTDLLNTAEQTLKAIPTLGNLWTSPSCDVDNHVSTPTYMPAAKAYYDANPAAVPAREKFICLPERMQQILGTGMAFGIANILGSGNLSKLSGMGVVTAFDRFFSGVVLTLTYFTAMLIFGMFLLDMLFRFIMTSVMAPMWLAAAVFPSTRFAFSQGVRQLARCALTLALMTVLIVLAAGLIGTSTNAALTAGQDAMEPAEKTAVDSCKAKGAAAAAACKAAGTPDKDCDMSTGAASPSTPSPGTPAPTTPPAGPLPAGSCPGGGGLSGGVFSTPPVNTQPWGGSPDPTAINFSCMMNVGGFTIGFGSAAFWQMLAGALVVMLYMSRVYNLAAMYVGVPQDNSGKTLGQLMSGLTLRGIGTVGGTAAGIGTAAGGQLLKYGGGFLAKGGLWGGKKAAGVAGGLAQKAGGAVGGVAQNAAAAVGTAAAPHVQAGRQLAYNAQQSAQQTMRQLSHRLAQATPKPIASGLASVGSQWSHLSGAVSSAFGTALQAMVVTAQAAGQALAVAAQQAAEVAAQLKAQLDEMAANAKADRIEKLAIQIEAAKKELEEAVDVSGIVNPADIENILKNLQDIRQQFADMSAELDEVTRREMSADIWQLEKKMIENQASQQQQNDLVQGIGGVLNALDNAVQAVQNIIQAPGVFVGETGKNLQQTLRNTFEDLTPEQQAKLLKAVQIGSDAAKHVSKISGAIYKGAMLGHQAGEVFITITDVVTDAHEQERKELEQQKRRPKSWLDPDYDDDDEKKRDDPWKTT
jgi:type IV secretory pathway VirB6-like protein